MDPLHQCSTDVFQLPDQSPVYELLRTIKELYQPIHTYLSIVLCAVGTVCNVCNIVVLTRKKMRSPVNMILCAMACCDTVVLSSNMVYTTHYTFVAFNNCVPKNWSYGWCVFLISHAHLSLVGHSSSIWLSVMLALIRYITLRHRGKSGGVQIGVQHSYIAIAFVIIFVSLMNGPNFLTYKISEQTLDMTCGDLVVDQYRNHTAYVPGVADIALEADCLVFRLAFWITGAVFKLFPCLLLTLLVSLLMRILREVRDNRQRLFLAGHGCATTAAATAALTVDMHSSQQIQPDGSSNVTAVFIFGTHCDQSHDRPPPPSYGSVTNKQHLQQQQQQQQCKCPSPSPSARSSAASVSSQQHNRSPTTTLEAPLAATVPGISINHHGPISPCGHLAIGAAATNCCCANGRTINTTMVGNFSGTTTLANASATHSPTMSSAVVGSNCVGCAATAATNNNNKRPPKSGIGTTSVSRTDRTTRMLLTIVCVFLVTELPQGVMAVLNGMFSEEFHYNIYNRVGDILDLLSLCNACTSFIIYCTMSAQFRKEFRRVFLPAYSRLKCWHRFVVHFGGATTTNRNGGVGRNGICGAMLRDEVWAEGTNLLKRRHNANCPQHSSKASQPHYGTAAPNLMVDSVPSPELTIEIQQWNSAKAGSCQFVADDNGITPTPAPPAASAGGILLPDTCHRRSSGSSQQHTQLQ